MQLINGYARLRGQSKALAQFNSHPHGLSTLLALCRLNLLIIPTAEVYKLEWVAAWGSRVPLAYFFAPSKPPF